MVNTSQVSISPLAFLLDFIFWKLQIFTLPVESGAVVPPPREPGVLELGHPAVEHVEHHVLEGVAVD